MSVPATPRQLSPLPILAIQKCSPPLMARCRLGCRGLSMKTNSWSCMVRTAWGPVRASNRSKNACRLKRGSFSTESASAYRVTAQRSAPRTPMHRILLPDGAVDRIRIRFSGQRGVRVKGGGHGTMKFQQARDSKFVECVLPARGSHAIRLPRAFRFEGR